MAARKNIVIGNWKMNLLAPQAHELACAVVKSAASLRSTEAWVAPTLLSLSAAAEAAKNSLVRVGSQNVHWADKGAFTGEVSVQMLQAAGATFAIVGHSERRHVFGESNATCARRALVASPAFTVVFCIGETAEERSANRTEEVLEAQLEPLLKELPGDKSSSILLAYEPVWAIGTGNVASIEQISETHQAVRAVWQRRCKAACPPILYGGSVAPDNFMSIIQIDGVDGALVGGASLVAEKFSKLLEISEQSRV